MELHETATLEMPVSRVWATLNDPNILKLIVPGCQDIKPVDESTFTAKAVIRVGFISSKFENILVKRVQAVENQLLVYEMTGEDSNKIGAFKQTLEVKMSEVPGGTPKTALEIGAVIDLKGKFATLGKRIVEWKAKGMTQEFMENLRKLKSQPA
jgi:uncharacterized protein